MIFQMILDLIQMEPSSSSLGPYDAALSSKDLGTFWSRRKKFRSQSKTNLPFSSFWSRRKKSRSLPSLPFSTIIRFVTYYCYICDHQSNLPRPDKNKRTIYWSKRNKPSLLRTLRPSQWRRQGWKKCKCSVEIFETFFETKI